jgi:hypothetical protein
MNSRLLTVLGGVVVVALAGVLGYGIIRGITADPAVVGSFLTAAVAFVAVEFGRQREKRLQLLQSHRERMAPIYEDLLKMMVRGARAGSKPDERFMREFQRKPSASGDRLRRGRDPASTDAPNAPAVLLGGTPQAECVQWRPTERESQS